MSHRGHDHGLGQEQLSLLYERDKNIDEAFARFHRENPHIYRKIVNLCREAKGAEHDTYSMDAIFHRLRWYHHIELKSKEPFKLNNNFTSRYARLVMRQEPDLAHFLVTRGLRAKGT